MVVDTDVLGAGNSGDANDLLRGLHDRGGCGQALAVFPVGLVGVGGGVFAGHRGHVVVGLGGSGVVGDVRFVKIGLSGVRFGSRLRLFKGSDAKLDS